MDNLCVDKPKRETENRYHEMPTLVVDVENDEFWGPILFKDGHIDLAALAKELSDFGSTFRTLGEVVCERAEGMSPCYKMYTAQAIIGQIDAYYEHLEAEDDGAAS